MFYGLPWCTLASLLVQIIESGLLEFGHLMIVFAEYELQKLLNVSRLVVMIKIHPNSIKYNTFVTLIAMSKL